MSAIPTDARTALSLTIRKRSLSVNDSTFTRSQAVAALVTVTRRPSECTHRRSETAEGTACGRTARRRDLLHGRSSPSSGNLCVDLA